VDWLWSRGSQDAFELLKAKLISLPELAYPQPNLPYELHCDSSNFACGAVVVQQGRAIAYASRPYNKAQQNYNTTEKECLAVAWAVRYFH
jgi:hypothetical protein